MPMKMSDALCLHGLHDFFLTGSPAEQKWARLKTRIESLLLILYRQVQKLRVSCFLWFGIKINIFGKRHHRMSHCPFLLPSYSSFLTFASGLHFGDLPLLLLVQPLQLGGLEDPRVHLEHPHRRLSLRAQHHQGEERQEGGVPAPCRRLVFTDCGVCAQESGSRCSCYLGIPPSYSSSSSFSSSFSYCCLTSSNG